MVPLLRTFPLSSNSSDPILTPILGAIDFLFFGPFSPNVTTDPHLAGRARASILKRYQLFPAFHYESLPLASNQHSDIPSVLPTFTSPESCLAPSVTNSPLALPLLTSALNTPLQSVSEETSHQMPHFPTHVRGSTTVINVKRISIPDSSEQLMASDTLLSLLPETLRTQLHDRAHDNFCAPIQQAMEAKDREATIFVHNVSALKGHYPRLLALCHSANMFSWTLVEEEDSHTQDFRNNITLSSFAVVKDDRKDRLISWPKAQNELGPIPPNPNLPSPDARTKLETSSTTLAAFHLEIQDMFHHLPLPPRLRHFFPLKPVSFRNLPPQLKSAMSKLFGRCISETEILRPFHATVPMGWN